MNKVTYFKQKGGLARTLPNEDHVSGLQFPFAPPPTWGSNILEFRSIAQVEASNITAFDILFGIAHYHASEFFRLQPNGYLYLIFNPTSTNEIRNKTLGKLRQLGIYGTIAEYATSQAALNDLALLDAPCEAIFGIQETGVVLSSLVDLNTKNYPNVSILIAGDGAASGQAYAVSLGFNVIPAVGAALGAVALASVHESIAYVAKFRMDENELEEPMFIDGMPLSDALEAGLDILDSKRYIFFRRHFGYAGIYFNDSHTAIVETDDYAYIESNRTINKAIRDVRLALLPQISAPAYIDATTGKLALTTVKYFETVAEKPLEAMENAGELSNDGYAAEIDPNQNFLSTSIMVVNIRLVPVGVARGFNVKIGFALQISQ